jgi:predicted nucleic acid-binding protein
VKRIVCDTGPLVHLFEANLLNLLDAAGKVLMPPSVAKELEGVAPPELKPGDLPWLVTRPLRQPHDAEARDWHRAGLLHLGEAEALALARQERADWFLTDDSAARVVAEQMAVEVHGSLGVLLWGAATGHVDLPAAEAALERLRESSLWVSPRVLSEARHALLDLFA